MRIPAAIAALGLAASGWASACGQEQPGPSPGDPDANPGGDSGMAKGWAPIADVGAGPIQETGVASLAGYIYVVGGFDESIQVSTLVQRYDPDRDEWSTAKALPRAVHHANVAAVGGKLYVVGSMILENFEFVAIPDVWEFDPAANDWSERAPMPAGTQRGGAAVAVVDGKIYVAGGLRDGAVTDFSSYDPIADAWDTDLAPLPAPRDHLVGGAVDGVVYAIGGRNGSISSLTDSVTAYDPGVGEWQTRASMPTARGGGAAGVVHGEIIVVGGEGNAGATSGVFDQAEAYEPIADTWRTLAPMGSPRHGMGAVGVGDSLYVPGGANRQAFAAVATSEVLKP